MTVKSRLWVRSLWMCAVASLMVGCGMEETTRESPEPVEEETPVAPVAESAAEETEEVSEEDAAEALAAKNRAAVEAELAQREKAHAGDATKWVRRGVMADREKRWVEVTVEATGIAPKAIVEFFVIGEKSGHDYEALLVSYATARDVGEALQFLGMKPGRNALASALSLWPRGERVMGTLVLPDGTERALESLVLDREAEGEGATLPVTGFVYCGSFESRLNPGEFAADVDGPCSLLSTYNEGTTLLDVPRLASQNAVYERFQANPDPAMTKGALLRIRLSPEERTEEQGPRVVDRTLAIREEGELRFDITGGAAPELGLDSGAMLASLRALSAEHDAYVTLDWKDSVTCRVATSLAGMLSVLDVEGGIRVEAPLKGQLYYRAFLPQEVWRDRTKRPTQPCELRLVRLADGALQATLVSLKEVWPEESESLAPQIESKEVPVPSVEAFAGLVAAEENPIAALLVFVPGDVTLGEVMPYIRQVQEEKSNVFIFVE